MAEDEGSAEKTEAASAKKKQDAREQGRVVTSKEMFVFGSMVILLAGLTLLPDQVPGMIRDWSDGLRLPDKDGLESLMVSRSEGMLWTIAVTLMLVGAPLIVVVLLLQGAMGGINFAPQALEPKFSKLDPMAGLGRMVSKQALIELGKAILKIAALGAVTYSVTMGQMGAMMGLGDVAPAQVSGMLLDTVRGLVFALVLVLAVIGALDLGWQMYSLNTSLMMTKQETKEESKESNGSPEVKGRMRRMQMEASRKGAQQRAALDDVPMATAVITNPTHFAVALKFVPGEDDAPVILAQGKGPMAAQIIARARKAQVEVMGIPLLARALFYTGDIGQPINEKLYVAVAAILAHVYRLERGEASDLPDVDLPKDMRFTPEGRPM
ncbi:MAG: flagellar biosynthesis protein FlhB [Rhodobacterales bacterium RIFCSPHIGHO2_02_FULL_62_130]|nr:MAG: flagellar biosynthesis protein FlhB [Rhodobacterales bacterium RIFCSPHIGHO2_02_FULL_62_130]OHC55976.1 MAG: flagellar biosynthesis protein FlhB [Rhodobacterales bacterium RIFCSPHIGHO2_12_FULL_62_75]HCY99924.1 flagellar biosynthesis protein FlhB [Rhodobacter sp.]